MTVVILAIAGFALLGLGIWQIKQERSATTGIATPGQPGIKHWSSKAMIAVAAIIAVGAATILTLRPATDDAPVERMAPSIATSTPGDVDTMIARLAARLEVQPDDAEGFRMLGWSYHNTGRPDQAVAAYARAAALRPDDADIRSAYGEAIVSAAQGTVTPSAAEQFDAAIAIDPRDVRSRYFQGLMKAQQGKRAEALADWRALERSIDEDEPWRAELQQRIAGLAGGGDASPATPPDDGRDAVAIAPPLPEAAIVAADAMPDADRTAMIEGMVDRLAARLRSDPHDAQGWIRLFRARLVLGQRIQARSDAAMAEKLLKSDGSTRRTVMQAAQEAGLR